MVVLLGAGASAPAGVPLAGDMTRKLVEQNPGVGWPSGQVINFVVGRLIDDGSRRGGSPLELPDVEAVVAALEQLVDRAANALAPFVATWEPLPPGPPPRSPFDESVEEVARGLNRHLENRDREHRFMGGDRPPDPYMWDRAVRRAIHEETNRDEGVHVASAANHAFEFLKLATHVTDPDRVAHLLPLVRHARDHPPFTIASLNYDNTVELASESAGVSFSRGVDHWSDTEELSFPESSEVRLLKLHGSVDWRLGPWRDDQQLAVADPKKPGRPAVIFGQGNKLTAEGPYLDLLAQFRDDLRSVSHLLVLGYSFRDDHVNEIIRRWLAPPKRRMRAVGVGPMPDGFTRVRPFRRSGQELRAEWEDREIKTPADMEALLADAEEWSHEMPEQTE
ncbi:MAG: SIR2 family protein [Acidimicrobiia bacterium]|nr:SIR2 family protein [Acidimicrobiia bacterium]